jgi:hypothetical protein
MRAWRKLACEHDLAMAAEGGQVDGLGRPAVDLDVGIPGGGRCDPCHV